MIRFLRLHPHVELLTTILLALAAIATAWSSYQSTRWSGVQATDFSRASALRVESTRLSTLAGQETEVDVLTFSQWIDAHVTGNTELASFYLKRFRPEFKPAFDAWLKTDPLSNPKAPPTPFAMPEYQLDSTAQSQRKVHQAEAAMSGALESNQRADNYVLALVLFAVALFFAGVCTKLSSPAQRIALLSLGYVIFIGTAIWVATFPITVSL